MSKRKKPKQEKERVLKLEDSNKRDSDLIKRPLRFCMVTTFYPPYNFGGDGIFVQRLSNELAMRGHHVEIVHCIDAFNTLSPTRTTAPYKDHPRIKVHGLKSRFGAASPILTHLTGRPFLKRNKLRQILSQSFDVIHYHNISLVGGPSVLQLGSALKLYTTHEYWLRCPTHLLYRFKKEPCQRKYCFLCSLSYKRPPQLWRHTGVMEESLKHVDRFIAPSQFCMEKHLETYPHLPMVHLPNFAPFEQKAGDVTEQSSLISADEPYFLFVGRLEKIKGLQSLIPVFKKYPKAKLCVAGSGKFEMQLKQLADDCPNIDFLGQLAFSELKALYQNAIAVILPYQSYEIFPQVLLESFSAGTPVIARRGGAMPEIVHESRGGFVYESDQELINHMDELLTNPNSRNELGQNAAVTYQDKWTPEAHLKQYFRLIADIKEQKLKTQKRMERNVGLEQT